jgi:hypothetical protein
MISTGSAQDDLQIGDVLTDPVGDGRNYTWDGVAWRSSDTVILSGTNTAGVSANGQQITIYDSNNSAFMNSTFISVGVNLASVGFRAHKNGVNQSIPNNTYTKVTFTTEDYDKGGYYDAANSRWTPPAGTVHFDGRMWLSGLTASISFGAHIYKNGVQLKEQWQTSGGSGTDATIVNLDDVANGTDYYELFCIIQTGTGSIYGISTLSYFSGHSVGGQGPQGIQGPTGPISPTWALLPTGFRACKNGTDQTCTGSATKQKVTFVTEDYDQGGYYDPVLSRWTPPAGMVHIDSSTYISSGLAASMGLWLWVYKNGVPVKQALSLPFQANLDLHISLDDVCNGADYYEIYIHSDNTANFMIDGRSNLTYFNGHMLGGPQGVPGPQGIPGAVDGLVSRVAFSAFKNADQTGIASETWTKVLFQATDFNDATRYNVGTSRWIPPSGRCQITGSVGFSTGSTLLIGTPLLICVYKNGTIYKVAVGSMLSTALASVNITIIDSCNGTDFYEIGIYLYTNTTATIPATNASLYTYFQGVQL